MHRSYYGQPIQLSLQCMSGKTYKVQVQLRRIVSHTNPHDIPKYFTEYVTDYHQTPHYVYSILKTSHEQALKKIHHGENQI